MINVEAGRLREPAAWLMIAIASTSVLVGIERLLFGGSSSFGLRAAGFVDDFISPVSVALLVGAVLLAGHLGPALDRLKVMVYVAVATLGLAVLFGVIGLFGGLFSGDVEFGRKIEFLLTGIPGLALAVVALLFLLPKAASAAPRAAGLRADGDLGRPQEQHYVSHQGQPTPAGQGYPQGGQASQGFQPQEQVPQGYPNGGQSAQQGFQSQEQVAQGYSQGGQASQGFQPQEQMSQGFQPQEQVPQGYPNGGQSAQQGFQPQEQVAQGYSQGGQASQGFQPQEQASQAGHVYPPGAHIQQGQPAPVPQLPYSRPALPPAPSSTAASGAHTQQQAPGYPQPHGDGYSPSAYAPPTENQPHGGQTGNQHGGQSHGGQGASYAPAQPAPQAPPAETYTPSPYVAADVQPTAQAKPYEPPVTAYDPPIYASPVEQPQAPIYASEPLPSYGQPVDAQPSSYTPHSEPPPSSYGQPVEAQASSYAPQPEPPQASFYQAQPEAPAYQAQPEAPAYQAQPEAPAYQAQPEAPAPYDDQPRVSFDHQSQPSFPQPPENYGQPFTGYSGAEFARPTEPNLHYPAPDPVDPRSQQMAQAYQQAESYQQQSQQGTEPQLRVPEYGASPAGGAYDDPFGHPQTPQAPPAAQPYQQHGGHQWDTPADATLRFDPSSYQGDPLNDPNAGRNSWDSQPAIDPTAIYKPERSAQVMGEETTDRERVGPGQEQNMSWYGSDRREH